MARFLKACGGALLLLIGVAGASAQTPVTICITKCGEQQNVCIAGRFDSILPECKHAMQRCTAACRSKK